MRSCLILMFLLSAVLSFSGGACGQSLNFSVPEPLAIPPYPNQTVQPGLAGPVVGLANGVLLFGGGANFPDAPPWKDGKKVWHSALILFEKSAGGRWSPRSESLELPDRIAYAASVSTPLGLAVLGGENEGGKRNTAWLFRWDAARKKLVQTQLPNLPEACSNAAAVWFHARIYLCGGTTAAGESDRVFSLDPASKVPQWREEPRLPRPVACAVLVRQSDGTKERLWLAGGRAVQEDGETEFYDSLWSWSPGRTEWSTHAPISARDGASCPLAAGTGIAAGASEILLFGGDDGKRFRERETRQRLLQELADSGNGNSEKVASLTAGLVAMFETHPGFDRTIYYYNTVTDRWSVCGTLPFETPVTTTVLEDHGTYIFPSGETFPGVRTPFLHFLQPVSAPHFSALNYGVLIAYMALMLWIGFFFARGNENSEDFFHCSGQVPWWAVGISLFATMLSAITFLAIPAKAYASNWNMVFFNFGIALIAPLVIRFYLPRFRQMGSISAYQYLEERFNRTVRWFASGLFCVFMVSRIAIVLYLPAIALNVVTGLNVHTCILTTGLITLTYSTAGGMKAVIWGDVIQGFILTGGAVFSLIWLLLSTDGGVSGFFQTAMAAQKFRMLDLSFDVTAPVFWTVLLGGCVCHFITYTSDQTVIQRYLSTTSQKEAEHSIWLNALVSIPITFVFFLIGTGLFTYYSCQPEQLAATLSPMDAIYPHYIVSSLPQGVSGLLIAAIFAASMSTLSSNINSASAACCADFVRIFCPRLSPRQEVAAARVSGIFAGLLGIALACVLATWNIQSLWDQFNTFLGLFTGTLGALFFMGFFMRNVNGPGAVCGVVGAVGVLILVQEQTSITFLLFGLIEIVVCCLIASVCSLFFTRNHSHNQNRIKEKS